MIPKNVIQIRWCSILIGVILVKRKHFHLQTLNWKSKNQTNIDNSYTVIIIKFNLNKNLDLKVP